MKIKSIFSGSALACSALLTGSLVLCVRPLSAETLLAGLQQQISKNNLPNLNTPAVPDEGVLGNALTAPMSKEEFVVPPMPYVATAYSLKGRMASGRAPSKGFIAADPTYLPLGSRVRLEAGNYSGEYVVADTGGMVRGRRIDIWTPSANEAMRFGKRKIKLTVLSFGGKRKPKTRAGN